MYGSALVPDDVTTYFRPATPNVTGCLTRKSALPAAAAMPAAIVCAVTPIAAGADVDVPQAEHGFFGSGVPLRDRGIAVALQPGDRAVRVVPAIEQLEVAQHFDIRRLEEHVRREVMQCLDVPALAVHRVVAH